MNKKFLFFLLLLLPASKLCVAQVPIEEALPQAEGIVEQIDSNAVMYIRNILTKGNRRTKSYIIKREMAIKQGDIMHSRQLVIQILQSKNQVYNTQLFDEVNIEVVPLQKDSIDLLVTVVERWYIYPAPKFKLTDRNYNEWIEVYNADLRRVIYGLDFKHYNVSGRRDQLRLNAYTGYARNIGISYTAPYSNIKLTEGFSVGTSFTQFRETAYATDSTNKLLQYKNGDFTRTTFSADASYFSRKGFFTTNSISLGLTKTTIADTLTSAAYNKDFLGDGKSMRSFIDVSYTHRYANTNNINYPLTGKIYRVTISKRGLGWSGGVNLLSVEGVYNKYISHGRGWYSTVQAGGKIKLPFDQPYINQRALGFGSFLVRGLDNYVIDGAAVALTQYTLRKKLVSFKINFPFKNRFVRQIPFTFYGKSFGDLGYVHNIASQRAMLNNKLLYTAGIGLDILTFYDFNFGIEYTGNQLNEKGFFIRLTSGF